MRISFPVISAGSRQNRPGLRRETIAHHSDGSSEPGGCEYGYRTQIDCTLPSTCPPMVCSLVIAESVVDGSFPSREVRSGTPPRGQPPARPPAFGVQLT